MTIAWLVLSVLLWGAVHSLLASLPAKDFARRMFGPAADRFYRLAYNLFSGASFLPVLWLTAALPDRLLYRFAFPWSLLALAGQALALILLVVGLLQTGVFEFLGLSQLTSPGGGPPVLVTRGLYRYVRHPLYSAGLLFLWLSPVMTVNLLVLYAMLTVYLLIGAGFEERRLHREFGDSYRVYQAITPMFIPFLKGNKFLR